MSTGKASTGLALRDPLPWKDLLGLVGTAEETGFEAVFVPEIVWREAFSTLAGFAGATRTVRLGTGVVSMTRRDAPTTAMAAATVHDITGGRFILGLGSGPEPRVDRFRSYLEMVRALLAGETVDGWALGLPPGPGAVPVWIAALGPRMVELAGKVADGVILNWCTPERVADARRELAVSAEGAGRDPAAVTVAVYVRAALGHEESPALSALRAAAGEYASMPRYRWQLEGMGLGPEAALAAGAHAAGDPAGVPEALVRSLCLVGERREAVDRIEAYRQAGADLVIVYPVPVLEPVSSIMGTLLAVAPRPAGAA